MNQLHDLHVIEYFTCLHFQWLKYEDGALMYSADQVTPIIVEDLPMNYHIGKTIITFSSRLFHVFRHH